MFDKYVLIATIVTLKIEIILSHIIHIPLLIFVKITLTIFLPWLLDFKTLTANRDLRKRTMHSKICEQVPFIKCLIVKRIRPYPARAEIRIDVGNVG